MRPVNFKKKDGKKKVCVCISHHDPSIHHPSNPPNKLICTLCGPWLHCRIALDRATLWLLVLLHRSHFLWFFSFFFLFFYDDDEPFLYPRSTIFLLFIQFLGGFYWWVCCFFPSRDNAIATMIIFCSFFIRQLQ